MYEEKKLSQSWLTTTAICPCRRLQYNRESYSLPLANWRITDKIEPINTMKSFLAIALLAIFAATASAFGIATPLQTAPRVVRLSLKDGITAKIEYRSHCRPFNTVQRNGASSMVMRGRVCDLLGKTPNRQARVITFSHKRVKKVQHVNLHWKKYFSDNLKRDVKLRLSTKGMKTVNKYGSIDKAAKKFKLDLKQF
eukprot:scaffold68763_cov59-Attheya_sp.AAC.2